MTVIGAGDPFSSASGDVHPSLVCVSLMTPPVPRKPWRAKPAHRSIQMQLRGILKVVDNVIDIYFIGSQQMKNDPGYPRPAAGGSA
jgi:hypothetical protein